MQDAPQRRRSDSPEARLRHAAAVERETRLASGMSADDARWVFARRVAEQLEGGVAAILTPQRRAALLATATRVGLRPFDANLVIALVQDGRRSGRGALNPEVERSLTLIQPADPVSADRPVLRMFIAASILGVMLAVVLARWL